MPGLLQTEAYARATLAGGTLTAEAMDELTDGAAQPTGDPATVSAARCWSPSWTRASCVDGSVAAGR